MTTAIASLPTCDFDGAIIVRAQEPAATLAAFRDRRCVVNEADSGSLETFVLAALEPAADGVGFFQSVHLSGSHRQCVEMVAGYEADVAAVDGSALAHLRQLYPALLEKVRVLNRI
jgi:ABC-type phosphate/phosphonate transport system substrate-binding protein